MERKESNRSLYLLLVFLVLGFIHTLPLWNFRENLAGGYGDPTSHASLGKYYCTNVVTGKFQSDMLLAPFGADISGTYDSPFPFILTCPALVAGEIYQFHIFALLQVLLIIFGAWLVSNLFIKSIARQAAYILLVWCCGFYVSRSHQHLTLLSMIWGAQFIFYAVMSLDLKSLKNTLIAGLLIGLSFSGTFHNIPSLFLMTLLLVAYKMWQERLVLEDLKVWRNLSGGALVSLVIFVGLWLPMIMYTLKNGPVVVEDQRRIYNLDLLSPLFPPEGNLVYELWSSKLKLTFERQNFFDLFSLVFVAVIVFSKKFWRDSYSRLLLVIALIYFVLSLGPELRVFDNVVSYLDFNVEIFRYFPFKISRTPARLALIANMCLILIAFLSIEKFKEGSWKKKLSFALVAWAIVMGPLLNQMWFFPTINYTSILPLQALTEVRNLPNEVIVAQIPTAWAQDPSQNFLQIFHNKRITSGYLAYTNYNSKVQTEFANEPFLGKLGCDGDATAFQATPFMTNADQLRQYLLSRHYEVVIVNKSLLLNNPACKSLTSWVQSFAKLPWVRALEENNLFVVFKVQ